MVISGGGAKSDMLKPKEVVSLLLDDEDIERNCKLRLDRILKNQIGRFLNYFLGGWICRSCETTRTPTSCRG